jgi:hypothetical protein
MQGWEMVCPIRGARILGGRCTQVDEGKELERNRECQLMKNSDITHRQVNERLSRGCLLGCPSEQF